MRLARGNAYNVEPSTTNPLAAETIAAMLNVARNLIGGAIVHGGPFDGKSVDEVIRLANIALGNGASREDSANLIATLHQINKWHGEGEDDEYGDDDDDDDISIVCPNALPYHDDDNDGEDDHTEGHCHDYNGDGIDDHLQERS